jgi:hypothetical protein
MTKVLQGKEGGGSAHAAGGSGVPVQNRHNICQIIVSAIAISYIYG